MLRQWVSDPAVLAVLLGDDDQEPAPIAPITVNGDTDRVSAIVAVLIVVSLWWVATHGKGGAALRLVAWLSAIIVAWLILAIKDPSVADGMPGAFASGIGEAASGIGHFLGML
jgi:hypothetical protein